ncbi:MAG: Smr/MutS family protein [Vicinamibacterales bacterium]
MAFARGDRVHFAGLGTGIVREARRGGRYAVEIKGRLVVAAGNELELAAARRQPHEAKATLPNRRPGNRTASHASPVLDLHGKSVAESLDALEAFVNDALLAGHHEARVIHGRSGGRVKAAVSRSLRQIPSVQAFRVDPQNEGVTIVTFW